MSTTPVSGDVETAKVDVARTGAGKPASGFFASRAGWTLCLTLLIALAILRIVSTYHVFNHTIDEPSHIACGVEWWEKGTFTIETKHPPLARISVALGPYLAGARGTGATDWTLTYPILSAHGNYWHNLTLGRIGVLPYFVIATLVVFFWTKRLFGAITGLVAAAVFTQLPTILAHSAVATTDVPLTAMLGFALYAFVLWLREPNARTAALFGIATALAVCSKFSTFVFLPGCALPILIMYHFAGKPKWRALFRTVAVAALCAFLVTWAIYRFSHQPLAKVTSVPERAAAKVFGGSSRMTKLVDGIAWLVPVPAPELFDGLRTVRNQNSEGTRQYFMGEVGTRGWWYFFFVAVALKTPIAVLLLAILGFVVSVRHYLRDRSNWEIGVPVAAAAMLMILTMPSKLDSGVRYVLPAYIFISILAAYGLATLWERRDQRLVARAAAIVLAGWFVVSSAISHPDYLAYFNEFGGKDPSRYIVIGDLDWGQDLTRLALYFREHPVQHVSIGYAGYYDPQSLGLPDSDHLLCGQTPSGWVAMERRRAMVYPECYTWFTQQQPVATVGKTMLVYHF